MGWGVNRVINNASCSSVINRLNLFPIFSLTALFLKTVRLPISHLCFVSSTLHPWHEVSWETGKYCGKDFHKVIGRFAWSAMVYFIWQWTLGFSKARVFVFLVAHSPLFVVLFLIRGMPLLISVFLFFGYTLIYQKKIYKRSLLT